MVSPAVIRVSFIDDEAHYLEAFANRIRPSAKARWLPVAAGGVTAVALLLLILRQKVARCAQLPDVSA